MPILVPFATRGRKTPRSHRGFRMRKARQRLISTTCHSSGHRSITPISASRTADGRAKSRRPIFRAP
jgi:AraC-like DNA-binding protein